MPDPGRILADARRCLEGGAEALDLGLASLPAPSADDDAMALLLSARLLHQRGRHPESRAALERLTSLLGVERACLEFQDLVFPSRALAAAALDDPLVDAQGRACTRLDRFAVSLVAEHRGLPAAEALATEPHENGKEWKAFVPDEDLATAEQVGRYYAESRRPILNELRQWTRVGLATYIRWLAVHVARGLKAESVFDFGGSVGVVTSAAARAGFPRVVLFETSREELEFARWRDSRLGIPPPEYVGAADLSGYAGQFDFGSCFEVLEHVWDVEGAVRALYGLLKPGGILMLTCSFGLYPHPEHLKKNVAYHGRELELFRSLGFRPVTIEGLGIRYPKMWFLQRPA